VVPNFGPGVLAAFMGAELVNGADTVWFHPYKVKELVQIELAYDPENYWLKRVKDVCTAAVERWDGLVQVGMTDLGANLDTLSAYRPSELLFYDLYDHPDLVKQKLWDCHRLWHRHFNAIHHVLKPKNPGYSSWEGFYCSKPFYMLQCDFSYMIGPEMFVEFVRPEIEESCRKLGNSFYHLDGPGALKHLDALLDISELDGIQWVPGAGQAEPSAWIDVHKKILNAGKKLHLINIDSPYFDCELADRTLSSLGGGRNVILFVSAAPSQEKDVLDLLKKYTVI
jgi:5-methyltetrahydrofolate--homocysteine methyltransferase